MDVISKQWSAEETNCLHALWSSAKIHNKLEGALRTKTIFQQLQGEMATVGFDRNVVEINSKPKKVPASKAGRAEMNTDVYNINNSQINITSLLVNKMSTSIMDAKHSSLCQDCSLEKCTSEAHKSTRTGKCKHYTNPLLTYEHMDR